MKTTGMVRRVDSLGRIVIPKEIRKVLKIKENEQVEINVSDDSIILNRYSELDEYDISLTNLIEVIQEVYNKEILVTNLNSFVLASNEFKDLIGCEISPYLSNILDNRKEIVENISVNLSLNETIDDVKKSFIIKPIIKNGDTVGLLILISDDNLENNDTKLFDLVNSFLDKSLE
ncbi:MAG: AbrB/MazE/SpoVT family DNA-binding domain-containing protein [Bacilli bacterium]|nr:AbrB/MazE/SpoVT family DNA-binding domain-containing protein [Bacilli bacterium]